MEDAHVPEHYQELIELLGTSRQSDTYVQVFRMIEDDNEETLHTFKRCLTTGSEQARQETAKFLRALVGEINDTHLRAVRLPFNEASWYPNSTSNLLWVWNSLNVLDECGIPYVDEDNDILIATNLVEGVYPHIDRDALDCPKSDEHWRGLAALAMTRVRPEITAENQHILTDYIAWAGSHSDISSAIDITTARGTLDTDTLNGVLKQQSGTANGLTGGIL